MRKIKITLLILILLVLVGCGKTPTYNLEFVNYKMESVVIEKGESYTLPVVEKLGYLFNGWYYDEDFTKKCEEVISIDADLKVYASFTAKDIASLALKEMASVKEDNLKLFKDYRAASSNIIYVSNYSEVATFCEAFGIEKEIFVGCLKDKNIVYALELTNDEQDQYINSMFNYEYIKTINNIYTLNTYGFQDFLQREVVASEDVVYNQDQTEVLLVRNKPNAKKIILPSSVKKISVGAFAGAEVESVDLSQTSMETVSSFAFQGCQLLKEVILPNTLKTIDEYAFAGSTLEMLKLPDSLEKIASYAFYSCKNLKEMEIPQKVKELGVGLFGECISLTKVHLMNNPEVLTERMLYGCTSLKELNLGTELQTISKLALGNCSSLEELNLPATTTLVEETAFVGMKSLTQITIPAENIHYSTVDGVLYNKDLTCLIAYPAGNIAKSYVMPDTVKTIKEGAFYNAMNLEEVTLSSNLEIIPKTCFYYAGNIKMITIPDSVKVIEEAAFIGCSKMEKVIISEQSSLEKIGKYAFNLCQTLSSIYIPSKVKVIEEAAFGYTIALKEINFAEDTSLEEIKELAFAYCYALENIILPNSVKTIENNAFAHCSKLKTIVIGSNIEKITAGAFFRSTELVIYMTNNKEEVNLENNWNSNLPVYYNGEWSFENGIPNKNE